MSTLAVIVLFLVALGWLRRERRLRRGRSMHARHLHAVRTGRLYRLFTVLASAGTVLLFRKTGRRKD